MQQQKIQRNSVFILFLGVAIFFDLVPWPGLGAGLIETLTQSLFSNENALEEVVKPPTPSERIEISTQNSFTSSARNDG